MFFVGTERIRNEEKDSNRDRQHEVKVRLNDEELKYLNGMVKAVDMRSREQFIRQLIMHGNIYEVDYSFLKENNYQISRLGHNIDQILKRINIEKNGIIHEHEIQEIKEALEKVWQLQRSILSRQP